MIIRMFSIILFAVAAITLSANSALAKDCGTPPGAPPNVPNGTTATDDQIRIAVQQVQDYGFNVQSYLNCLQLNREDYFLNMSERQRERWTEDFNAMADALTEVETELNDQIRVFNSRS